MKAYKINKKACLIYVLVLSLAVITIRGCAIAHKTYTNNNGIDSKASGGFYDSCHISIYNNRTDEVMLLGLEEYIYGVTAAEMPASYEAEALKAQAIAARTFTVRHMKSVYHDASPCGRSGADICTDSGCCQAWRSDAELQIRWGQSYEYYSQKVTECVIATHSLIAAYDNKPIEALYHASSGGETEDSENVFAAARPYLRSVSSPGEEEFSKYFTHEVTFDNAELISKLNAAFSGAKLTQNSLENDLYITERYESGRVKAVHVGNATCSGKELRQALQLKSTDFAFEIEQDSTRIATRGYGHGVGMSQCGANAMANSGNSCNDIIAHYYTGASIVNLSSIFSSG